eukprot:TRINITY_DN31023_c0_g1_i1.p2 TRINITY_DN31023_c0_g1~~TRINITY_DN31023_c0_g1_i1.p2  ORF type:complete len:367 (+),score=110.07 TRINITY_DN31023_c0_g1_i1:45-1103(+)
MSVRGAESFLQSAAKRCRTTAPGPIRVLVCSSVSGLVDHVKRAAAQCAALRPYTVEFAEHTAEQLGVGGAAHDTLKAAEVLLADPGAVASVVDNAESLRWMQSTWAGVNALFSNSTKRDYLCTRSAGFFGQQMAEYVLLYVLSHTKRAPFVARMQGERRWCQSEFQGGTTVAGKTVGFLGAGEIAVEVARACAAVGMRCIAFRSSKVAAAPPFSAVTHDVTDIFRDSDFVVNLLPSTPATRNILTAEVLGAGKRADRPAPVFINVGRGDVVSEDTLVSALDSGRLSAAVLDVFAAEPLRVDSPLWGRPDVTITPHIAALSPPSAVADLFVRNLGHWVAGQALEFPVSWEKGY